MHLLYIDESGVSSIPGNTSHFVLTGIAVPIWHWKDCDREISVIKQKYDLVDAEIHTAWIMRPYLEQARIPNFDSLQIHERKRAVTAERNSELLRLQRAHNNKIYKQTKKNYKKTNGYIHLTYSQRKDFITEVAECVSNWGFARVFSECINKIHFDPVRSPITLDEQAFEQVVSRFEQYLSNISEDDLKKKAYGLLIHDNNETVSKKHTRLMKSFYDKGTTWTDLEHIIETPLFVDSELTSLVQIADLCAYAIRRYLENDEDELFNYVYKRADRKREVVVGVRHFSIETCLCKICDGHAPRGM